MIGKCTEGSGSQDRAPRRVAIAAPPGKHAAEADRREDRAWHRARQHGKIHFLILRHRARRFGLPGPKLQQLGAQCRVFVGQHRDRDSAAVGAPRGDRKRGEGIARHLNDGVERIARGGDAWQPAHEHRDDRLAASIAGRWAAHRIRTTIRSARSAACAVARRVVAAGQPICRACWRKTIVPVSVCRLPRVTSRVDSLYSSFRCRAEFPSPTFAMARGGPQRRCSRSRCGPRPALRAKLLEFRPADRSGERDDGRTQEVNHPCCRPRCHARVWRRSSSAACSQAAQAMATASRCSYLMPLPAGDLRSYLWRLRGTLG